MSKTNIETSGFSLAKRQELTGDDFYDIKVMDDLTIAVVCDGVGSAQEGAAAAKKVTTHLITNFKNRPRAWSIEKSLKTFIKSINQILYAKSIQDYERPELVTTVTVVVIQGDRLYGANVGDSRIYLLRDNSLNQLSFDHSMDEVGYENVLTAAVGIDNEVEIFYFENDLLKDDKVLLCSDGLYSLLDNDIISQYMINGAYSVVKKASALVENNLPDDTTAVVLNILGTDEVTKLKRLDLSIPEKLTIGDEIDGYVLTKSLIQNDRTWICEKKGLEYVIKFAPKEAIDNEDVLDLFVKEVWNAKRLKAGFFPKTTVPKKRSARYYIMPKIDGINLKEYLKKRALSIEESITLAKTLLNMSQYLLKFDLVHGDIKPENIMVSERDGKHIFKVIDFGSITEVYSIDSTAGTPSYLAPERFNQASINEKTEIFSIGVTLYEALTGKFPYGEIEPFQNPSFKIPKSAKSVNTNIPSWFDSVLSRSITANEEKRYENYTFMLYEIDNPLKVAPFFNKNTPMLQKDPLMFYKIGFYTLLLLNIVQMIG